MVLWMYKDSFDSTQWEENLVAVSSGHENYDDSDDTVEPTWLATQTATNATSNNGTLILEDTNTFSNHFVFKASK